jgi:hypothetical protein
MNLADLTPYLKALASNWKTYVSAVVTVLLIVNAMTHTVCPEAAATVVAALASLGVILHVKADGTPTDTPSAQ